MGKKAQRRRAANAPATHNGPPAETVSEFFDTPLDRSVVDVDLTPQLRLARIVTAHSRHDNPVLGGTTCNECEERWPCPTVLVATAERFAEDPFEARDRGLYRDVGMG